METCTDKNGANGRSIPRQAAGVGVEQPQSGELLEHILRRIHIKATPSTTPSAMACLVLPASAIRNSDRPNWTVSELIHLLRFQPVEHSRVAPLLEQGRDQMS